MTFIIFFLLINPLCNCNLEYENAEHYFFRCANYPNERTRLFNETGTLHLLNLDILLYGVAELSLEDNMSLFKSVQTGVVGWCEGAVYLTSLGRPTDIGLQLGKACYPCSG